MPTMTDETKAQIAPIIERVNAGWVKSTEAVLDVAKELAQAKKDLGKELFNFLCKSDDLKITRRTIDKLVMIGEWKYIDDAHIQASMPQAWSTIYEMVVFEKDDSRRFTKCLKSGEINPDITRSEVLALKKGNSLPSYSTTKSLISIEVDEKLFQDPSGNWDLGKLEKLKTYFNKSKGSQNVTINCGKIDSIIEGVEKKRTKDLAAQPEHESKITKKLSKMVDDKINKSPSILEEYKDLDETAQTVALLKDFHSPHTIENYVRVLYGKFKMKEFPTCYMGTFQKEFFDELVSSSNGK